MASKKIQDFRITGLIAPPVTPFKENGDVNLEVIKAYVQHYLDFNIPNVYVTGTTGEGLSQTVEERKQVAQTWVKEARGKLSKVIIHVGTGNLKESQELARHAEEIGADAIACVGPTYHKPDDLMHYVFYMRDVAAAAPNLPFYLYDIDFYTGIPYTAAEFFHVAGDHIPTLKGLKHTSPNMVSMTKILTEHGGKYEVFMGCDDFYLAGLAVGIDISICSSYLGHVHTRMIEAFKKGDMQKARLEQKRSADLIALRPKLNLSIPAFVKAIMQVVGVPVGSTRLPLRPLTQQNVADMKQGLTDIGFFDWAFTK